MFKKTNRRKLFFTNKKFQFYYILIIVIIFITIFCYYNKNYILNTFISNINTVSEKFNYQFKNLNVNGLKNIEYTSINNKLKKYKNTSIFLLPLNKIKNELKEFNWIKEIKISTNLKDTLYIELVEYIPIGIYSYNNQYFLFNLNGKIIDKIENNSPYKKKLILFFGQSSNLEAKKILKILNEQNFIINVNIKQINFINKRRWDVILKNDTILMLSESVPEVSLQNFSLIEKNLSETDLNNIKSIDLRNINKTIINYF